MPEFIRMCIKWENLTSSQHIFWLTWGGILLLLLFPHWQFRVEVGSMANYFDGHGYPTLHNRMVGESPASSNHRSLGLCITRIKKEQEYHSNLKDRHKLKLGLLLNLCLSLPLCLTLPLSPSLSLTLCLKCDSLSKCWLCLVEAHSESWLGACDGSFR